MIRLRPREEIIHTEGVGQSTHLLLLNYKNVWSWTLCGGHVLTFQSPSKLPSLGSMDATTCSETSTSPVLLSVTCEDRRRVRARPISSSALLQTDATA